LRIVAERRAQEAVQQALARMRDASNALPEELLPLIKTAPHSRPTTAASSRILPFTGILQDGMLGSLRHSMGRAGYASGDFSAVQTQSGSQGCQAGATTPEESPQVLTSPSLGADELCDPLCDASWLYIAMAMLTASAIVALNFMAGRSCPCHSERCKRFLWFAHSMFRATHQ
jgi:hypothetical protein